MAEGKPKKEAKSKVPKKAKEPVKGEVAKKEIKKIAKKEEKRKVKEKKQPVKKAKAPEKKAKERTEEVEEPKPEEEKKEPIKKKKPKEKKEKPIEKIKLTGKKILSKEEQPVMRKIFKERSKKPKFLRQEFHKLKRLDEKWRRPRGIDSKRQDGKRSKGKVPCIGYKKSLAGRGIHPSGYYPILIKNLEELKDIKPGREAAIIASSVGRKKRNSIIKLANELRIAILNPRKGEL